MEGVLGSSETVVTASLPDRLQRQLHDVERHLLPVLKEAAKAGNGALDLAEHDLHQGLARAEEQLNAWAIDVVDLGSNERERQAWADCLSQARTQLFGLRQSTRRSLFEARKEEQMALQQRQQGDRLSAYGAQRDARGALFADMATSEEERQKRRNARAQDQTADEQLMTASGDVTAALQRAVQLMSNELEKSSYSAQLLDESSVALQQATVQYTSFSSLVASSRKLIASMERADFVDACLLLLSFLFFVGCILYIVKVRVWDRGVGIVSFFFRFLGLASSRSPADVKEKLAMAKQAAMSEAASLRSSSRMAAEMTKSAWSASAAAAAASLSASASSAASAASAALQASSASAASAASIASASAASLASAASASASSAAAAAAADALQASPASASSTALPQLTASPSEPASSPAESVQSSTLPPTDDPSTIVSNQAARAEVDQHETEQGERVSGDATRVTNTDSMGSTDTAVEHEAQVTTVQADSPSQKHDEL